MKNLDDKAVEAHIADSTIYHPQVVPLSYKNIFKNKEKLTSIGTTSSKTRDSIVELYYDNKFYIQIYKVGMVDQSLSEFVTQKQENLHRSYNHIYRGPDSELPFEVNYKSGRADSAAHIYFNVFGIDTHVVTKNDTVVNYYSSFKNLAVQYSMDRPQEIFFKSKTNGFIPVNVSFIKRKQVLYFVFLSAKGDNTVEPGTLSGILK